MNKFMLLVLLFLPLTSSAIVIGGSNLGIGGYPEFTEIAPMPPYSDDRYAWENYRRQVDDYTEKAKQYLEDSNSDMQRIKKSQQEAIRKANEVVEEYNSAAQGY